MVTNSNSGGKTTRSASSGPMSQAAFARLAGVSRQAINDHIKDGRLVLGSNRKLDPENGTNKAYLARAVSGSNRSGPAKGTGGAKRKKARPAPAPEPRSARPAPEPEPLDDDDLGDDPGEPARDQDDDQDVNGWAGERAKWDLRKIKEQALTAEINRQEKLGRLVDVSIVTSQIGAFLQGVVSNFVDSPQRQAIQICQMLGVDGREKDVVDYLEKDNARRLEEVDRAVTAMRDRLRRSVRRGVR